MLQKINLSYIGILNYTYFIKSTISFGLPFYNLIFQKLKTILFEILAT